MKGGYELVRFEQNGLTLDVNVSPTEDTVWLSKEQNGLLFGRDRSVISRHINNIYEDGELSRKSSCAKNAHEVNGQTHYTEFFNLDVIISIGYRVKSKNGVAFRKWALNVLKEYLLRGYVLDGDRTLVTNENYINLINKVENIDMRLARIESKYGTELEKIFFDGEYLDARVFIKELLFKAMTSIAIVDSYADAKTLNYLSTKRDGVSVLLVVSSRAKMTQDDVEAFNRQYGGLTVKNDDSFHDRFILLDGAILYHLGASLNYAGKRTFAIARLNDERLVTSISQRINAI